MSQHMNQNNPLSNSETMRQILHTKWEVSEEREQNLRDREREFAERTIGLECCNRRLEEKLSTSHVECSRLDGIVASLSSAQADIKAELDATQKSAKETVECGLQKDKTIVMLKGRIAAHEATIEENKMTIANLKQELSASHKGCSLLNETIASLSSAKAGIKAELDGMEKCVNESVDCGHQKDKTIAHLHGLIAAQKATIEQNKMIITRLQSTLKLSTRCEECPRLKGTVASLSSAQAGIKAELEATQMSLNISEQCRQQKDDTIAELWGRITAHEATIHENEMKRRKLHNTIQEIKGNIRVFCRVRPLLGDQRLSNKDIIRHIHFPDVDNKTIQLKTLPDQTVNGLEMRSRRSKTECSNNLRQKDLGTNNRNRSRTQQNPIYRPSMMGQNHYQFSFDRVFKPTESQAIVFDDISELVQSALDGFNVCIFAYGQTGSGKTYTMEGPVAKGDMEQQGMISRAVQHIFQTADNLTDKGWKYEFEASFLEVYNENIRDLLGSGQDTKHKIKMVSKDSSELSVTNLTSIKVSAQEQVHELLLRASGNRAVAETKRNERSSRSHSIFWLKITGHHTKTDTTCIGQLNLIDLAGSERLKESDLEGARLKETQSINNSLAELGNVIMALAKKDAHIPYRRSKLTRLLQHSLSGNGKTLMFVNVSPKLECFVETLNSLRFATKVNQCGIGRATRNMFNN